MSPHQQRVVDERADLDAKRERLAAFMAGPVFAELDSRERQRMRVQARAMTEYSTALRERIEAFEVAS